jgi:hypothetical protein
VLARTVPALAVLALACSQDFGEPKTRVPGDTGPEAPEPCDITVDRTWPDNGETDHYYRDPVEFFLSAPDETAVVEAPVAGRTDVLDEGRTLRFTPDAPFEPDAPYSFNLDYCGGRPRLQFDTSPAGLPITDLGQLVGRVWLVDLAAGRFTEGEAAGELLAGLFGRALLLGVTAVEGDTVHMRGGVSAADFDRTVTQDTCFRTVEFTLSAAALPDFVFDVQGFTFASYETDLTLAQVRVEGTVHPEGVALDGTAFSVSVSGAELAELIPGVDDSAAACDFAADLGVPCAPCPDGSGQRCVTVAADRLRASAVSVSLEQITDDNVPVECSE